MEHGSTVRVRQAPVPPPSPNDELYQALRTNRALRDQVRRERQYCVEQEVRHRAEIAALHAQHQEEIEFIMECRNKKAPPSQR